jgi:uncharacterized Zn-finger protein
VTGQKKIVEKLFEANQKRSVEKLWKKLFSDPSQWWDHRSEKVNENNFFHNFLIDGGKEHIVLVS